MEILMTQLRDDRARSVAVSLMERGHEVSTCAEGHDDSTFACAALRGDACPIDARPVDIAVHVPFDGNAEPGIEDEGVLCALRQHIPLVLVAEGPVPVLPDGDGFAPWAAAICEPSALEATLVQVLAEPLELHSVAATEAANDVLGTHGVPGDVVGSVRRVNGGLHVDLVVDKAVPQPVMEAAAVRAHDAVRLVDNDNRSVDVSVSTTGS